MYTSIPNKAVLILPCEYSCAERKHLEILHWAPPLMCLATLCRCPTACNQKRWRTCTLSSVINEVPPTTQAKKSGWNKFVDLEWILYQQALDQGPSTSDRPPMHTSTNAWCILPGTSGVAKVGHTRARALATRGCAPPVQVLQEIIGAECTVINRELGSKSAQRCWNRAVQYCYLYLQNNEVLYAPLISMYACLL